MPLYLRESNVDALLSMPLVIDVMEQAFKALAQGEADNVPRVRAKAPGVVLHSLNAAAEYLGVVGWKQYVTTKAGAKFLVGLHDATSGELIALIQADRLGQLRTGAMSGLAIKLLTERNTDSLGLIGSGWQAESQLLAAVAVRPIRKALVYSRNADKCREFAQRMAAKLSIEVEPIAHPRRAVEYQPIVITATSSKDPVFEGDWLAPGTLVCAMGSNWLHKAELDAQAIRAAQAIVCDSIAACQTEAGDFVQALSQGLFRWQDAIEFADVVAGKVSPRKSDRDIIIFKSVGMGIEDVALAAKVVELAKERGVGVELDLS
jgi:ornithine cyclodeaminase/alanine dehydrogenase-like protein (mu-crystallin family)